AVECIPFSEVIETLTDETRLDLPQIDAEGADGRILSWFPFDRIKPAIVHWEIKNMTRLEQETALDLLCSHQYLISRSGEEDMLAVFCKTSYFDPLPRCVLGMRLTRPPRAPPTAAELFERLPRTLRPPIAS